MPLVRSDEVLEVELEIVPWARPFGWDQLRARFDAARIIPDSDPSHMQWSYSPWAHGRLRAQAGWFTFQLFLGGRGTMHGPDGARVHFEFEAAGLS